MELPTIGIVAASVRDACNRVLDAQGRGPDSFTRTLAPADPAPTPSTTPTHYFMQDMSATDSLAAAWQALANVGDLPAISGVWGEDGVISAAEAQAACAGGNMHVYTAAGPMTPTERDAWRDGILAGRGLAFIPFDI